jgi:uncharacterized protein YkwD
MLKQLLLASAIVVFSSASWAQEPGEIVPFENIEDQAHFSRRAPRSENVQSGMTLTEARQYMLGLINKDRAKGGLPPVVLDEVATRAGQQHTDEMASYGYEGHWDLQGRQPPQRYTEMGGQDFVAENAYGLLWDPGRKYRLSPNQFFQKEELDEIERSFINEKPPMDGHRKNILDPDHTAVGIGLSICEITTPRGHTDSAIECTQEFVNDYGEFSAIPAQISPGDSFEYGGILDPGVNLMGVEVKWEALPQPIPLEKLRGEYSHGYYLPNERVVNYYAPPAGPINLRRIDTNEGSKQEFRLTISIPRNAKPGLYYLFVWAKQGSSNKFIPVSCRTIICK